MWGFAGSPLVIGSNAIVWAGGKDGKGLLAFDVETGALRWSAATGDHTYASPQLNTIAGEEFVLMLSNDGLVLVEPATGKVRLNYEWKFSGYRALQPRVVGDDTVLLGTPMNIGTRAIRITKVNGELVAKELWTSLNLKPDFSDMVTYQGYIYGNDGGFLTCLDLKTGDRMWKGGRYGKGQLLLLENASLVLVAAEDGQVHLVRADPKEFVEVDSFKALEGKTWNHPVVVGDKLYVRNSQEAAGFQLSTAKDAEPARKIVRGERSTLRSHRAASTARRVLETHQRCRSLGRYLHGLRPPKPLRRVVLILILQLPHAKPVRPLCREVRWSAGARLATTRPHPSERQFARCRPGLHCGAEFCPPLLGGCPPAARRACPAQRRIEHG